MRTIKRFLLLLVVLAACSCAVRTASLQAQFDKRLTRLEAERDKLKRTTDPIDRTKTDITIADVLLSLAGDAVRAGEPELLEKRLNEYVDTIQDAHQTMVKSGRDAERKPGGFKELEIALRKQMRILEDIGHGLTFDQREPVDKARQQASEIHDDLFKALFGERNAPNHKS
jgi:hypothetical protein